MNTAATSSLSSPSSPSASAPPSPSSPLLSVEALHKTFEVPSSWIDRTLRGKPRTFLHAVDDVSFSVQRGQTLSLVGESGCGKSTIARCVSGLYKPSRGTVRYKHIEMSAIAERNLPERRDVQMIFQDPYASLNPRWTVGRSIADPIKALGLQHNSADVKEAVALLLGHVGLAAGDASKYPHQFSGGQRQRIAIARALSTRPSLIVCDEPTSALDVSVQAQILNTMRDLQDNFGLTFLFISHNLAVVDHMSDQVGVMYLGRLVEIGDRRAIFSKPMHPYTRNLVAAVPTLARSQQTAVSGNDEAPDPTRPPRGCAFHSQCGFAQERCRNERPVLRQFGPSAAACHRIEDIS